MGELPLAGIRVLDLSRVIAGPFAGQMMADLGAEVVKIELPGSGDDLRRVGPPWFQSGGVTSSTYFLSVNRGKRSVDVDLTTPEGADFVRELAGTSDILLENFRTGTLARWGLDYATLSRAYPRLIYCSITGFGQTGPRATESGYDYLAQAMSGMMRVNGLPPDAAGSGPLRLGVPVVDIMSAKDAAIGILAALTQRHRTGRGQHVDVALFDSALGCMLNPASAALNGGDEIGPTGNAHPSAVPYGVFPTSDGRIVVATFNNTGFVSICRVLGHPEWATDPRFLMPGDRVAHRAELEALMEAVMKDETRAYWIARFNEAQVSCGPILDVKEALADPQVAARKLVVSTAHPVLGEVKGVRLAVTLSEGDVGACGPSPLLGEGADRYGWDRKG